MLKNPEFGYTPDNLRRLLDENNLSQKEAREYLAKGRTTFSRYLYDIDNHNHVSMSHRDWLKLVNSIKDSANHIKQNP